MDREKLIRLGLVLLMGAAVLLFLATLDTGGGWGFGGGGELVEPDPIGGDAIEVPDSPAELVEASTNGEASEHAKELLRAGM